MLLYGTCDLEQLLSHPEIAVRNAAYLQETAEVYYESPEVGADLFSLCVLQGEQKQRQYCCLITLCAKFQQLDLCRLLTMQGNVLRCRCPHRTSG
jgi:hypothetical protein